MPLPGPGSLTVAVAPSNRELDRLVDALRPPIPVTARAAAVVG